MPIDTLILQNSRNNSPTLTKLDLSKGILGKALVD